MTHADFFSPDYFTARERFRAAAQRAGGRLEAHAITAPGPGGEELTIDVAIFGGEATADAPARTLVVSSGVHGVEGFFGSAVQLAALEKTPRLSDSLPRDARLVMIHAVNPYGFAFRRRWNEENVDVNRNLLREGEPFTGSPPLYAALDGWLNPTSPPGQFEPFLLGAAWKILRHGRRALAETLPVGQYEFPKGLFFGGREPTESNRILAEHFERWLGPARDVLHIDFHTGLGRHGTYELYLPFGAGSAEARWFESHFDAERVSALPAGGASGGEPTGYPTRGSWDKWCLSRRGDRNYRFATAEFGTHSNVAVVAALRAENRAHHWGAAGVDYEWTKRRLMEAFVPASTRWRETVVASGLRIVEQAVRAVGRASLT